MTDIILTIISKVDTIDLSIKEHPLECEIIFNETFTQVVKFQFKIVLVLSKECLRQENLLFHFNQLYMQNHRINIKNERNERNQEEFKKYVESMFECIIGNFQKLPKTDDMNLSKIEIA